MASTFPQQKDVIQSFLDVNSSDFEAINGYQNAIRQGDFASAQSFLVQISNADRKIISADRLNQIKDALDAVQQFYKTDIQSYVNQKQAEWQNIINQLNYIGRYSSTVMYKKNNLVVFNDGTIDLMYICQKDFTTLGHDPTNTEYWRQFTVKGATGMAGGDVDTTFMFNWDSSQNYGTNVLVVFNNKWWISLTPSLNQTPQNGSSYWKEVMSVVPASIPITSVQPSNQNTGALWFRVV